MKKLNPLKGLRVILAALVFIPILFYFVDFANLIPDSVHNLLHLQVIPALMAGLVGVLVFQFLLAFLFGRIYCSVICPAGILQDIINRLFCLGKTKKKGARRFSYHKPKNALRYSILSLTLVSIILGVGELALLLDPYSNFGRIANNIFRPIVMWSNNLLAELLAMVDNYTLYNVTITNVTAAGLIAAITALIVFIVMVVFRGRLFCNTICPVGTLLSLISRYSLFRITFDKESCTSCGNCERSCKAEAIDFKNMTVDTSRCVDCFNCISSCPKGGLQFRFNPSFPKKSQETLETKAEVKSNAQAEAAEANEVSASRRTFLAAGATMAVSLPLVPALAHSKGKGRKKWPPITPPGSLNIERFKDVCTGCQLCVVQCPSHVLRPCGMEYGWDYLLKPRMAYIDSYCNYSCTVCSSVCPNGAIQPITQEEKETTQVGIATFFKNRCIVKREETDCGACAEHCPTQAVHMVPFKGTLTIPEVNPDLCIGCGGCESICPVRPMRAIIVKANTEHKRVEKPKEEEVKKVEVDDFGF